MRKKNVAIEGQQTLFDLLDPSEMLGSHSDDLEDLATRKTKGRKSKICPTWVQSAAEMATGAGSYSSLLAEWKATFGRASRF